MFPLIAGSDPDPAYLTLDEALDLGVARVTEVSEGGSVPDLHFDNDSDSPVLLVDGEELVGARQNRVLNLTILVAAHSRLVIPVSCVERGRWAYRTREFRSAKRGLFAKARAVKMEQVTRALKVAGSRRFDQYAVWEEVSLKCESLKVDSPTEAMSDIYDRERSRLDESSGYRYIRILPDCLHQGEDLRREHIKIGSSLVQVNHPIFFHQLKTHKTPHSSICHQAYFRPYLSEGDGGTVYPCDSLVLCNSSKKFINKYQICHARDVLDFLDHKIPIPIDPSCDCRGCVFTDTVNQLDEWKSGTIPYQAVEVDIPDEEFV